MKRIMQAICALCVALALLFPAAASSPSARLTDLEQARHREAVTLMVDLGVIQGKVDGSFDPQGTVDRATMARLFYGILMGSTDPAVFAGVDSGLSDIGGHWAENYIKYCASVGIIAGKGGGVFDPDGLVNVASAAKMALVTLGYDALERGYASDPLWTDNIMEDAEDAGLLEGVEQFSFEPITRDNAARLLYNTLFAYTYTPRHSSRDGSITGYTQNPTTLGLETLDLVRYTVRVGAVPKDAPPEVSYVSLFPKPETVSDEAGVLRQLRSGEAGPVVTPELAGSTAVFYVKAGWTLSEDRTVLQNLALREICSSVLTPREDLSPAPDSGT